MSGEAIAHLTITIVSPALEHPALGDSTRMVVTCREDAIKSAGVYRDRSTAISGRSIAHHPRKISPPAMDDPPLE